MTRNLKLCFAFANCRRRILAEDCATEKAISSSKSNINCQAIVYIRWQLYCLGEEGAPNDINRYQRICEMMVHIKGMWIPDSFVLFKII